MDAANQPLAFRPNAKTLDKDIGRRSFGLRVSNRAPVGRPDRRRQKLARAARLASRGPACHVQQPDRRVVVNTIDGHLTPVRRDGQIDIRGGRTKRARDLAISREPGRLGDGIAARPVNQRATGRRRERRVRSRRVHTFGDRDDVADGLETCHLEPLRRQSSVGLNEQQQVRRDKARDGVERRDAADLARIEGPGKNAHPAATEQREQKAAAIREKHRRHVSAVALRRVELGRRSWRPARGGHAHERRLEARRKDNRAVLVPGPARAGSRLADRHDIATRQGDAFQPAVGEEGDRPVVG